MEQSGALAQMLLVILSVGVLSLLAHWGRKNRGAEFSLIFVVLLLSFLVLAAGGVVALVGWAGMTSASVLPQELSASSAVILALAGLAGLALCVPPLLSVTRRLKVSHEEVGAGGHAVEGGSPVERSSYGGFSWSDPPTFFALWMFVVVLTSNALTILAFALSPEAVGTVLASTGRVSPATIALSQVPLVVIALLGVGLGVRRNLRETLARLGYGSITLPQLGVVALFVAGALLLSFATDWLFGALQPDLFERVGEISEGLFSPEGLSPVSAILFALLIGIGAAVGEETLFRGAVQPALGITLVSILWASMHVQYGPSIVLVYIFVLSVGLGVLRKRINTTATFLAHAGYNALGVLLAYLFGA